MSDSSPTPSRRQSLQTYLPTRRAWWAIAAACGVGLLLFVVLWLGNRGDTPTPDDDDAGPGATVGADFDPLPAPLPAATENGVRGDATTRPPSPVRIDAHVPRTAPQAEASAPATAAAPAAMPGATSQSSQPRPISAPAPAYPRAAMRRGESGEVLLRVHVDAEGRTRAVDLVRSSQHRRLDRAATDAVRRWRFEPATREGRPVEGELLVPFDFTPSAR